MAARKHVRDVEAMEARSVDEIPQGGKWQYEPKWDGFRCLLNRQGKSVTMTSKSGQDLTRYFHEVVAAALALPEKSFTLDGEIVVPVGRTLSFDALLQRIHPVCAARARGRRGGRPKAMSDTSISAAKALIRDRSMTIKEIAAQLGIFDATLYKYIPHPRTGEA